MPQKLAGAWQGQNHGARPRQGHVMGLDQDNVIFCLRPLHGLTNQTNSSEL